MCDCYNHKCANCDERIPMHIGDFCLERGEIDVYCSRHIPKNFSGSVWKWLYPGDGLPRGFRCGIYIKGIPEDGKSPSIIHPNSAAAEQIK